MGNASPDLETGAHKPAEKWPAPFSVGLRGRTSGYKSFLIFCLLLLFPVKSPDTADKIINAIGWAAAIATLLLFLPGVLIPGWLAQDAARESLVYKAGGIALVTYFCAIVLRAMRSMGEQHNIPGWWPKAIYMSKRLVIMYAKGFAVLAVAVIVIFIVLAVSMFLGV